MWCAVAKGIREGDFETASREKSRIEVRFLLLLFVGRLLVRTKLIFGCRMNNGRDGEMKLPLVHLGN